MASTIQRVERTLKQQFLAFGIEALDMAVMKYASLFASREFQITECVGPMADRIVRYQGILDDARYIDMGPNFWVEAGTGQQLELLRHSNERSDLLIPAFQIHNLLETVHVDMHNRGVDPKFRHHGTIHPVCDGLRILLHQPLLKRTLELMAEGSSVDEVVRTWRKKRNELSQAIQQNVQSRGRIAPSILVQSAETAQRILQQL